MEQPEDYKIKLSEIDWVDINAGKQIWGSMCKDNNKRSLVLLVDKAIYEMMDSTNNW